MILKAKQYLKKPLGFALNKGTKDKAKLFSVAILSQGVIQIIGFLSGLLIIRFLSIEEYAYYTIANTALGTMMILADAGIVNAVMAEIGKEWGNEEKIKTIYSIGMKLRNRMVFFTSFFLIPFLIFMLHKNGVVGLNLVLISTSVFLVFLLNVYNNYYLIIPKLNKDILYIQKNQLQSNLLKIFSIPLGLFFFPFAFIANGLNIIPVIYSNLKLKTKVAPYLNGDISINRAQIEKNIIGVVKRILPTSFYYCISAQLTIWLLTFLGKVENIAEVGAISRLAMILTVFSIVSNQLIVPSFAKLGNDKKRLFYRFFQAAAFALMLYAFLLGVIYLFPEQIFYILGKSFSNENNEMILITLGSCMASFSGLIYTLYLSKGWVIRPVISISINLFSVIGLYCIFDVQNMLDILYLNISAVLIQIIMNLVFIVYKIKKL